MQWYYANDGKRSGPVSAEEFERLAFEGVIRPSTLVWRDGMKDWVAYESLSSRDRTGVDDGTELCAASGKRYPRREMIQFEGKWISAEHRDAYFQRLREGVTQPNTFVYGSFMERVGAKILDGIVNWVLGATLNAIIALVIFGTANYFTVGLHYPRERVLVFQLFSLPLGILLNLAYVWFFLSRYDATPGKMAVGLKVVRSDGSKLSNGRIVGRFFAEWLSGIALLIGYLMAAFDDERRTLHDRICDTRVIKSK
jgi:uncharacterized RDD family membrane protein YckC